MSDLVERLRKRAEIRRQIPSRKSVQNNEPDRIADLLEEAASVIEDMSLKQQNSDTFKEADGFFDKAKTIARRLDNE